jgi:5-amino-6-(5-phosphoribosylamino)uracil reductase
MTDRPYVLLSAAMSVDGYIDDTAPQRLVLSGEHDIDRVDAVRAGCDAILVGAATIRRDNPRLLLRSARRQAEREASGRPAGPVKVTLSRSGDLDPGARFFTEGAVPKLVYAPGAAGAAAARQRLGAAAEVVELPGPGPAGPVEQPGAGAPDGRASTGAQSGPERQDGPGSPAVLTAMLDDLAGRGVARLMVEGGSLVQASFLAAGLADELQLAIAPFFVADPAAPRLAGGRWPAGPPAGVPMRLAEVRRVQDMAVLRYLISGRADPVPG